MIERVWPPAPEAPWTLEYTRHWARLAYAEQGTPQGEVRLHQLSALLQRHVRSAELHPESQLGTDWRLGTALRHWGPVLSDILMDRDCLISGSQTQDTLDWLSRTATQRKRSLDWRVLEAAGIGPLDLPLRLWRGVRRWQDLNPAEWRQLDPYEHHLITFAPLIVTGEAITAPLLSVADWLGTPLLHLGLRRPRSYGRPPTREEEARYATLDPQPWLDG